MCGIIGMVWTALYPVEMEPRPEFATMGGTSYGIVIRGVMAGTDGQTVSRRVLALPLISL